LVLLLVLSILTMFSVGIQNGYTVSSANLSVSLSGNVLAASRNSTLTIEIQNVGKYLTELDVALTVPPPIVLFGDNHWIRSYFGRGDVIRANLTVFAPSTAAGLTLQGAVVAVYKLLGETIPSTETHAISFLIRGWIDMKVYEITISPDPSLRGTEITISGNLLNRGVIPAMYANVSIAPDPPIVSDSIKPTYVGQVDPNAPAPFSVTALVGPDTAEGRYQTTIVVYYRDDLQADNVVTIPVWFSVVAELPRTQTSQPSPVEQLLTNQMLILGLVVIIVLVVVGIVIRRRRKASET